MAINNKITAFPKSDITTTKPIDKKIKHVVAEIHPNPHILFLFSLIYHKDQVIVSKTKEKGAV
jgi:hypothetical protein